MTTFYESSTLIQSARLGNLEAFNQLVLIYQDLVYNQAFRMLGEAASASDAVQDAFINAYLKLHTFRGGSFKVWLLRIVTNLCYDELRRRKRRQFLPLEPENSTGEEIESPYWLTDPGATPEQITERGELRKTLQECLDRLSANSRSVLVLIDIQGLNYAEAAEVLGISIGTVKSRLARARERLRASITEGHPEVSLVSPK
jgi:RNA polymerase sigma-70 factor (ECF subfamily)